MMGESIMSALVTASFGLFHNSSRMSPKSFKDFVKYAASDPGYHCSNFRPLRWAFERLDVSFMFYTNKGMPGTFDRPAKALLTEMGLEVSPDNRSLVEAPDFLVMHTGQWDLQEGSAATYARNVPKFVELVRTWMPNTTLLWIGPFHHEPHLDQLILRGFKELRYQRTDAFQPGYNASWRTGYRAVQYAHMLSETLHPLGVPLINPISMFSALDATDRNSHYRLRHHVDFFSLLLNAFAQEAPGRLGCSLLPGCREP